MKNLQTFEEFLNENVNEGLWVASDIIGTVIKIGNLEIAEFDLNKIDGVSLTLPKAQSLVKKLGKGWRIPTREELNILHQNVSVLSNIKTNDFYMSSETFGSKYVWVQNLGNGKEEYFTSGSQAYLVRPVKTI